MTRKMSTARQKEWQDPEIRAKRVAGARRGALARYEDPEERAKASAQARALYDDPAFRERNAQHLRAVRKLQPDTARGLSRSPEYSTWKAMGQRCHNPKATQFKDYGGRGITVCSSWRGRGGFLAFYDHVGPRPSATHSIGRIDNAGNYEPGNVRWETRHQQMSNFRRTRLVTIRGVTETLAEWSRKIGVTPSTLARRIALGLPDSELLAPPDPRRQHGRKKL